MGVQTTQEGEVVLDLSPLVQRLSGRFGIQAAPDAGKITILHSGQLKNAQRALKVIKVLSVFLLVLVLFLYGLAIYLAHGHRRRLLRATAASFLLVGVLVLVIDRLTEGAVVGSLIKTDAIRPAGTLGSGPSCCAAWRTRSSSTEWPGSSAHGSRGRRAWQSELDDGWRPCSRTRPGSSTEPWPCCSCS